MNNNRKNNILERYVVLAKKLGKLPSKREAHKFGITSDSVSYNFDGKHSNLVKLALEKHPYLKDLEIPAKLYIDDIENFRLNLEKSLVVKQNKSLVENASTLDYIEKFADRIFKGRIKAGKVIPKDFKCKRIHTLQLSDLHFGADLKSNETGSSDFGKIEESRRFAAVIKQASMYKSQYRKTTKLVIVLNGDIIENNLHDSRTGAVLSEQVARAIHLLSQGVGYLANHYNEINVECSTGNHDRNTSRHKNRAIHQKFDSIATIIYYALKKILEKCPNVSFNITKTPLSHYTVFNKKIAYTHGDTVINPGNPYTSVNVKNLENQINKINAALLDKDEYVAVLYGHTHLAHVIHLSNGTVLIGNGALPPSDHFGVSLGNFETNNGQWIFESVKDYPVGDMRLIKTGKDYDKDSSLDIIIKPWTSFNE